MTEGDAQAPTPDQPTPALSPEQRAAAWLRRVSLEPRFCAQESELLTECAALVEAQAALIEEQRGKLARAEAAEARERWISVEEQPPEAVVEVQVYVTELNDLGRFKYQQVSSLCDGRWQWLESGARPTHWRPLPAPPAGADA